MNITGGDSSPSLRGVLPTGQITAYRLRGDYDFASPVSRPGLLRSSQILASQVATQDQTERIRSVFGAADTYGDDAHRCFIPRFGFTVGTEEETVDILICIECYWAYFFRRDTCTTEYLSERGRQRLIALYLELFPGHDPEPSTRKP